eukprot:Skav203101  [mRNA]  locus=scaffold447:262781:267790:+ [translate_table: standard]
MTSRTAGWLNGSSSADFASYAAEWKRFGRMLPAPVCRVRAAARPPRAAEPRVMRSSRAAGRLGKRSQEGKGQYRCGDYLDVQVHDRHREGSGQTD